ncbi:MAG: hypothetical protein KY468_11785 [Armatimonadetes bacterium]|nr:hypothetical protein [Armatimonadota bacterium]
MTDNPEVQGQPLPVTFRRHKGGEPITLHKFGPKEPGHYSCGVRCEVCGSPMEAGQYTTLVPFRCSEESDPERWGNWLSLEVHYDCVAGQDPPALQAFVDWLDKQIVRGD